MTSPEAHKRYNASEKGKARRQRYVDSGGHRESQRRYAATSKGKLRRNWTKRARKNVRDRETLQELVNLLTEGG